MPTWKNKIYFGDNLKILREEIASESVDLVYLDPPFNSNANYNVLFKEQSGERSAAQVRAFDDTWHWTHESAAVYQDLVTSGPRKLAELVQALLSFLGHNDVMAYLVMMAARLVELHRVLKSTGSIYLHCDPTASHYLKLVLDAVFGGENFKTEIVWKRSSAHSDGKQGRRQHGRIHDVIFYYTKLSGRQVWNQVHIPYDDSYLGTFYRHTEPETGRRYTLGDLAGPGGAAKGNPGYELLGVTRHWRFSKEKMAELLSDGRVVQTKPGAVPRYKRYLDEMQGVPLQDVWTDIPPIGAHAQERLGYPTQKPEALLERIIQTSSNEGDVVLDPFCGCGTAVAVAERLKRRWIGIDITYLAINLVQRRLRDNFRGDLAPYVVHGAPTDLANAVALKDLDPFQFEWWAVDLVDARPAKDRKRGADSGVDGYIYFFDDNSGQAKKLIVQVKSGHVGVHHIRDLKGTMEREQAVIGAFLTLEEPTPPMKKEAAAAGFYQPAELPGRFPRIQIRTIAELLDGKKLEFPPYSDVTFARAERKSKSIQPGLFRQDSSGDD